MKSSELFGELTEYKKGDIVVWGGYNKAILRIAEDFISNDSCHMTQCARATHKGYNSLHYSNLRLATRQEVELLGNLEILKIKSK